MLKLPRHSLILAFEGGIKGRPTFKYLRELERSQWLAPDALGALQFRRLQALLDYAYEHCPYYRTTWNERGLHPSRLRTIEDFERWPTITRETIREHRQAMRSCEPGMRLISKATGGSSGAPLHFDLNLDSNYRRMAASFRGYAWAGAGPGVRQLRLWGVPLGQRPWWRDAKDRLYEELYRQRVLNCFDFPEERVEDFRVELERHRPEVIVAYTNPLYAFARALDERKIRPYSPRSIVVGAEKLHGFQRALIERVFEAPVFETYGSREFMLIGAECERHAGLHLTDEHLLVELVDDDGRRTPAGAEGNIVVTDLFNLGMPFVRYLNGDRGVAALDPCECGRGLSMLSEVVGRQLDILETVDGRRIPGEFFPHLFKDIPAIRRFQVIQESLSEIHVRVVLRGALSGEEEQFLHAAMLATLGPAMKVKREVVEEIPMTGVGKHQVVVNRMGRAREAGDPV